MSKEVARKRQVRFSRLRAVEPMLSRAEQLQCTDQTRPSAWCYK